jgi:hypothetical protein
MKIEYMTLEELESWPRNPKRHDIKQISGSMQDFGYVSPIIIDEKTKKIVAGHGRLDSLKVMRGQGKEPPERIKVKDGQWSVPVLRGVSFKSEKDAERFLVADNRITELGGWDNQLLVDVLSGFVEEDEALLTSVGFEIKEYDRMVADLEKEPPTLNLAQEPSRIVVEHTCPKCGFKFNQEISKE